MMGYFGQPSGGFFLDRDFLLRSFQLPVSFKRSAFGPGVAFFLEWLKLLAAFFLLTNFALLRQWFRVHQALSFCALYHGNRAFSIVHFAIVPQEIKLP